MTKRNDGIKMTSRDKALIEAIAEHVLGHVVKIEKRLAALESRPEFKYLGTWTRGTAYVPGNACTHRGSMWYCVAETGGEPGPSAGWRLAVKRGADGRP